jgi:UDP-sulfoquinovose synthase
LTLAIENPPKPGEYRVFNQLDEVYNLYQLAEIVVNTQKKFGLKSEILPLANPRLEMEDHYYKVDNHHLRNLGFKPTHSLTQEIEIMFEDLLKYKERIEAKRKLIPPTSDWRHGKVG